MPGYVFISYDREHKDYAERLARELQDAQAKGADEAYGPVVTVRSGITTLDPPT